MGHREKKPASETPSHSGRPQSLRRRLLTLLGVALLVTLLIIGAGVSYFVFLTEQKAWQGRQEEAARNAVETVAAFIQHLEDSLTLVSLLDYDYLTAEPQVMRDLFQRNPAFLEMVRLDARGKVFASAYQDAPLLANLFTIPQSTWFLQASAGELYLGNIQISPAGDPYLIIAVPAPDGGVVAARLRMNVLWDVVAAIRFGETGQAYVVNQGGRIVAHTKPEVVLAKTSLAERPELAALSQSRGYKCNGAYVNFEGTSVVGTTAPVPGTGWVVITELSQAEAFAVSRTAGLLLGGGMLLFGVVVMWVTASLLGRLIFQPMERLRAGAERIGQGDLRHRIDIARQDEVGQVAESFNEMVGRLREHEDQLAARTAALAAEVAERKRAEEALRRAHDELEMRVQERTTELAKANEALRAEITARKQAEEQIRASLREKEVLLKEIHHRVKNNLQVISSLLYLQSKKIKDKQTFEILQDSQNRVRSMALVHERLYQSKDLARVDFAEYARNLASYIFRSHGVNANVIKLKIKVDDVFLGIDMAVPCGLILNELVSNSLKHAFPGGREGEIRIELRSDDDGQFTLMVSDNGVGIPKDLDFRNTESLGLQLVDTLVNQLEGTIELDRSGGTAFEITFTELKYKGRG